MHLISLFFCPLPQQGWAEAGSRPKEVQWQGQCLGLDKWEKLIVDGIIDHRPSTLTLTESRVILVSMWSLTRVMVEVVAPSTAWFTPRHSPVARGSILDLSEALSGSGSVYRGQRPPSAAQISVLSLSTSSTKKKDESRRAQDSRPQIKKILRFDFLLKCIIWKILKRTHVGTRTQALQYWYCIELIWFLETVVQGIKH